MEQILNNPGFVHLAENIFVNLGSDQLEVCEEINQSSKVILANPFIWLRKFKALSKENQNNWTKIIQSEKNSSKEKYIVSYLKWNLKTKIGKDLPCYNIPIVQDDFRMKIRKIFKKRKSSKKDTEILKILAPLTDNPNAPDENGRTPIHNAAYWGHIEMVKILVPWTDNPNAPDKDGRTPILMALFDGHSEIVKILLSLTDNPNAPDKWGQTPIHLAASNGHTEIVRILAPLTNNPNALDNVGWTPIHSAAKNGYTEIVNILEPLIDYPN